MVQKILLSLLICVASAQVFGQTKRMPFDRNQKLQIVLLDSIIPTNGSEFDLRISLRNKTDTSFILYGFKVFGDGGTEEFFKQPDITAGSELFPVNQNGQRIKFELYEEHERRKSGELISWSKHIDILNSNKVVLQKKSMQEIKVHISLVKNSLKERRSTIYFIYYSGKNITNIIVDQLVDLDEIKNEAILYQGYAKSNTVKLVAK